MNIAIHILREVIMKYAFIRILIRMRMDGATMH